MFTQDRLSSLLKTAENLKVRGLAEVSGDETEAKEAASNVSPRLGPGPPPMTMMGRAVTSSPGANPENNNTGGFININGEIKRKRGRPRTLDGPDDGESESVFSPRISMVQGGVRNGSGSASPILSSSLTSRSLVSGMSPLQAALCKPLSSEISNSKDNSSPAHSKPATPCPASPGPAIKLEAVEAFGGRDTPGSGSLNGTFVQTLSAEKVASWGIIKMNDYLVSGTRQQYWEEYFVKNVMAVSLKILIQYDIQCFQVRFGFF